jgi:pimeloyl-ACP methyl ester carboxylesterase
MTAETARGRLQTFTNDGLVFDVIDEGRLDGPAIIALHGFPQRSGIYRGMIPSFVDAGFRVLAPDQRGYSPGARPQGVRNYAVDRLVADVLALADQAELTTFHVLGHDWGATLAWALAAEHPDRVATISVLSVPHPRAFLAALPRGQIFRSWYMMMFQLPWLPEQLIKRSAKKGDDWMARRLTSWMKMSPAAFEQTRELCREPGAAAATVNWYRALRYPTAVGKIRTPTLYVWSTEDAALGRDAAERTAEYVAGPYRFEVLEGVSHWIPEERPREVAAMVIGHVAEHRR